RIGGTDNHTIAWNNFLSNRGGGTQLWNNVGFGMRFEYNHWNDMTGPDNDSDFIVDDPYDMAVAGQDQNPLVKKHNLSALDVWFPNEAKIQDNWIAIQWSDVTDSYNHDINYSIYLSDDGGLNWNLLIKNHPVTTTDLWTPPLSNGDNYAIKVVASCSEGLVLESVSVIFAIKQFTPSPPRQLRVTHDNQAFSLEWSLPHSNGSRELERFNIYKGTSFGNYSYFSNVNDVQTYTDYDIIKGVRYYYAVSAVNEIGESPLSYEYSSIILIAPDHPENLILSYTNGYIQLNWDEPLILGGTPVSNYSIYRGLTVGSHSFLDSTTQTSYIDTSIVEDVRYYYVVTAINIAGEGSSSNEQDGIVYAPTTQTSDTSTTSTTSSSTPTTPTDTSTSASTTTTTVPTTSTPTESSEKDLTTKDLLPLHFTWILIAIAPILYSTKIIRRRNEN
ncbi:MAG: fibronectin type III domain-containing protein, partial [Candidatus Kariarchaeaceae archaeon]